MRLTVLGKFGPYPQAGGACSGYLVEEKDTKILMDAGPGVLSRLCAKIDLEDLDAIWLSHLHFDHTSDLLPLRYLLEKYNRILTIYAHREDTPWCNILLNHPLLRVVSVDENTVITEKDLTMRFYPMKHTVTDYAVKITGSRTLLYSGDTQFTPVLYEAAKGSDLMLVDCAKPIGFNGPHMTAEDGIRIHKETGIPMIATHLSPGFDPTALFADYPDIRVAEEDETYNV